MTDMVKIVKYADGTVEGSVKPSSRFDGNYHCAKCGKVFRIQKQMEFTEHQRNCKAKSMSEEPIVDINDSRLKEFF